VRNLHIKRKESVFSVPKVFVDRYMPLADEKAIKVYLYLLCHLNDGDTSFETVSQCLKMSSKVRVGVML